MPGNSLRLQGNKGTVFVANSPMAELLQWSLEMIEPGRYSFVAERMQEDVTRWPFRDRSAPIVVELPMRRSTLRFRVMLSTDSPLAGEASLDANTAEQGDFW